METLDPGEEVKEAVEDKFKFAILQVDKRLVNLEVAIGEINEKIKSLTAIDASTINAIRERLDELEDLIMVENLGGMELKKFLENIDSKTTDLSQRTIALSKDVKNFEALVPQIEQAKVLEEEIKKLRDRIGPLETSIIKKLEEEISDLKEKGAQLALKEDVKKLEKNIERMNEKIAGVLLPTEQIIDLGDKILALEEKIKLLGEFKEDLAPIKTEIIKLREKTKFLEASLPLEKMNKIEEGFFEIKERFSQMEEKMATLPGEALEDLQKMIVPEFEEKIKPMSEEVKRIENRLNDIDKITSGLYIPTKEVAKLEKSFNVLTSEIEELKNKTKTLEPSVLKKIDEKISGVEDSVAEIENRAKLIEEVKKDVVSLEERVSELRERIRLTETSLGKKVDERISALPLLSEQLLVLGEEVSGLKEEISRLVMGKEQIANLENEIKRLNERIKPLETQVIQRVASEISDLREETSKEIKEIKDKISGIIATKSEMDIKFLSSRLNSLKENIDYLLNRKAEFDLKLDNLQKALAKLAGKTEEIASRPSVSPSLEERMGSLEEKIEAMPNEIFSSIKNVFSKLPEESTHEKVKTSDLDFDLKKLVKKISYIESKLMSLEEEVKRSGNGRPLIVE